MTSPQTVLADLQSALGVTELVPLAQGGQKFVLRCLRQGRPAAVKVLLVPPGPAVRVAFDRARRETAVLAAVDSPRVVRLLADAVELRYEGDLPYGVAWVEELLDGADLDTVLDRPWEPARVARLLVHLAEALAAFHQNGFVHRDVNACNVRERADGSFTLMDPGLARRLADGDPGDADRIGTIGYRSPEHAAGGSIRPWSDVFCVGILAYRALTGRLPIEPGATPHQDAARLGAGEFPSAASLRDDIPVEISDVVDRCLRGRPQERFHDGTELLAELGKFEHILAAPDARPAGLDQPTALAGLAYSHSADTDSCADSDQVVISGAFGERRVAVKSIAVDQEPFAVRLRPSRLNPAPGLRFSARTIDLGDGRITNSFSLTVDPVLAGISAHSDPAGFHLPDLLDGAAAAALSGSFSFISDQPDYQPAEPCLDLCARDGRTVSLPTVAKPAFLVCKGFPLLRNLDARGTLRIAGRPFAWTGSKTTPRADDAGSLTVFGAANCRVRYELAPRTGFLRLVDRSTNTTPADEQAADVVVSNSVVTAVREGGGTDLFEGGYILRGPRELARELREGDQVEISTVDGLDCSQIQSGFSVGPSLAAAHHAGGDLDGYDDSLGLSPFLPGHRYARTLIGVADGLLHLRVFDGAPLSRTFQGVSCAEAAGLMAAEGFDPAQVHHLDGGQSSKMAFTHAGAATVLGSMHYLLWPKNGEGDFQWHGPRGRVLRSALVCRSV
ncbi:MAG TPA: serine/threonine-protein kinase [Actinocrinis sp.]|nr:serine/threonine-protein kinase [Actinocrinis sp.]